MLEKVIKTVQQTSHNVFKQIEALIDETIKEKGGNTPIGFPETAYYLPLIYSLSGLEVKTLDDLRVVLEKTKSLMVDEDKKDTGLIDTLNNGTAALLLVEIAKAIEFLKGTLPKNGFQGFIPDSLLRSLGVQLVDGRLSAIAVIVGAAPESKSALKIIRGFQEKNILSILVGKSHGTSVYEQLKEENVEIGLDTYIVPLGDDTQDAIFAVNWAVRAALTFGGLKGGEVKNIKNYCKERVPAFVLVLGEIDEVKLTSGTGAISLGFPVIADSQVPEIKEAPTCLYEALTYETNHDKLVSKCIETRGIKVKITKVPIPVMYGAAFEGERIRKEETSLEFGGKKALGFELVIGNELNKVENGKIELIGPEIDETKDGDILPLGIIAHVAGRKMQKDFEPILERQVHHLINCAMGIMHVGQRSSIWIRISKEAKKSGFKIKDLGEILISKFLDNFPSIVDKVEIKILTTNENVKKHLEEAKKIYKERDDRIGEMTDESVDVFYSCTLCQSFAPNHVCIITPERLGLCGAYNWLDGKASHEINPTGPNQPIKKGGCLDPIKGKWKNINDFVHQTSNKTINSLSTYSIIDDPMTSCGCFECIVSVLPGTGGVMVVDREFHDMTPCGMTFSTLAGIVGGGQQTPGFIGVGKNYLVSKKFISADGGLKRLVWMPSHLKEELRDAIQKRADEEGSGDLLDKIADETKATTIEELVEYLISVSHPAPDMGEMI